VTELPYYLVEVSYTAEAWKTLVKNPQNRMDAVSRAVEKVGGKFHGGWFAFGQYDVIIILEMPDNVAAAANSIAYAAGGACSAVRTTPLLTPEEAVKALKKASETSYRPPT